MDFRQLKYFAMVAEAGSFTRAAELLRLAQPALSSQIHKLEEELQEQLLVRHSRGIDLTEAGRRLLVHARAILHQIDVAREDVRGTSDEPTGLVRVGMPRSASEVLAVELIREAGIRAPGLSIRIVEHFSEVLYGQLLERELDLALSYSSENSVRVTSEIILRQRLALVSPIGSGLKPGQIAFSDVARLPLILRSPTHAVRKLLAGMAAEMGLEVNVVHEIDSLETSINMVKGRLGHTILPVTMVEKELDNNLVEARDIISPDLIRTLYIMRPSQSTPTKPILLVRNILMELFQKQSSPPTVRPSPRGRKAVQGRNIR